MACGFYSGFTRGEYRIALVDFIAPCGGTKEWGRRDLRIPPSPPSGLSPFQPWGIAAAGYWAAAGLCQYWIPVSGAIVTRQFRILYSYLCSGWYRSRFSRVDGLVSHVFHYWGGDRSYLRLRGVFAMFFRRICADRDWIVSFGWKRYVIIWIVRGLDCMGYPFS